MVIELGMHITSHRLRFHGDKQCKVEMLKLGGHSWDTTPGQGRSHDHQEFGAQRPFFSVP